MIAATLQSGVTPDNPLGAWIFISILAVLWVCWIIYTTIDAQQNTRRELNVAAKVIKVNDQLISAFDKMVEEANRLEAEIERLKSESIPEGRIPGWAYYDSAVDSFRDCETHTFMPMEFQAKWFTRKNEFATDPADFCRKIR